MCRICLCCRRRLTGSACLSWSTLLRGKAQAPDRLPTMMFPVNPPASAAFLKSAAVSAPPGTLQAP